MATITLQVRLGIEGAWNEGKPVRGDRDIMVDGVKWGHVIMVGHGCHGPSYEFYDAEGAGIHQKFASGKLSTHSLEAVRSVTRRRRFGADANDNRSTEERIMDRARELMEAGRMRDPAELLKDRQASAARYRARRDEEQKAEQETRDGLLSIWARDLTNLEREALSRAWKDLFHGPIEKTAP